MVYYAFLINIEHLLSQPREKLTNSYIYIPEYIPFNINNFLRLYAHSSTNLHPAPLCRLSMPPLSFSPHSTFTMTWCIILNLMYRHSSLRAFPGTWLSPYRACGRPLQVFHAVQRIITLSLPILHLSLIYLHVINGLFISQQLLNLEYSEGALTSPPF